ncbi:MAG: vitamin B12-dependent ribonucleotide reductase, partial [Ignavibacteriales bacterium]|nr:vitamin B12-dependent ribonucleotide reductase [Ignavibacteriales bacterium]
GVPLKVLTDKFSHARYEPSGFTNNPEIPIAKSISDYIFRWLGLKFLPKEEAPTTSGETVGDGMSYTKARTEFSAPKVSSTIERNEKVVFQTQADAPPCHECGSIMIRSGSCYKCLQCGSTSGCS